MKRWMSMGQWIAWALASAASGSDIVWDSSSLTLIEAHAGYGRIVALPGGGELCAFSRGGDLYVRRSSDGGATWQPAQRVDSWVHGFLTNAELLALRDGSVLLLGNARPVEAMRHETRRMPAAEHAPRFDIRLYRSADGGATWGGPQILFTGGHDRNTGCWEPAGLELPCGEVHIYFANDAAYPATNEQEISLLRSVDGGRTWSAPETVGFCQGRRMGMPVPLLLRGGGGVVVAVEDNGWDGPLQPTILHTTMEDLWRSGPVTGGSPRRWYALAEPPRPDLYGGAPYICQLPSGVTVLSYQERIGDGARARMMVCVGDDRARGFVRVSPPFPDDGEGEQLWNALYVRPPDMIIALTSATIGGRRGLWSIQGRWQPGR